jgi:hypothetical protein
MTDFPQLAAGRKQNQIDTDCRLSTQPKVGIDWAFWAIDIKHDDEIGLRQHLPQNALMCFASPRRRNRPTVILCTLGSSRTMH